MRTSNWLVVASASLCSTAGEAARWQRPVITARPSWSYFVNVHSLQMSCWAFGGTPNSSGGFDPANKIATRYGVFVTDNVFTDGKLTTNDYYWLGVKLSKFRNPGDKFVLIEYNGSSDWVQPNTKALENPTLATKSAPFSNGSPTGMFIFRHPGLTANFLFADMHVDRLSSKDELNSYQIRWSYNGEKDKVPTIR